MSVLIDTSVWSLGLRRRKRDLNPDQLAIYYEWEQLLIRGAAVIIGPVIQEVLSGIPSSTIFDHLRQRLSFVEQLPLTPETFILAADFYNTCRAKGISPESIDMTICAAAHLHHTPIFTTDPDFPRYARLLPIPLLRL